MRQVFLDKGKIVVKQVSTPLLDDHAVLVQVHYSFISSGSEIESIERAKKNTLFSNVPQKVKQVLESVSRKDIDDCDNHESCSTKQQVQSFGYSCSGVVIATGKKVQTLRSGDLVACAGECYAYHADVVCVPQHLVVRITDKSHLKYASIVPVGSIALQGIRRAQLQIGEIVCVIGVGLLGQITVQLAKCAGCKVIAIDLVEDRLALAQKGGADAVYNARTHPDIVAQILHFTQQHGVDTTIITATSESDKIVQQAMEITRKKGRIVLVGDIGLKIKHNPFYIKEIDMLASCSYGPGRYDPSYEKENCDYPYSHVRWTENRNMQLFADLVSSGKIDIGLLVGYDVNLERVAQAYGYLKEKKGLGAIVSYETEKPKDDLFRVAEPVRPAIISNTFVPAVKDTVRVGVVGAGDFAQNRLMPIISKIETATIDAVVDTDTSLAMNVSRRYGAAQAFGKDEDLFFDDLVDVVVISSPHQFHCAQTIRALQSGKAVFLEKPMVTDFVQLKKLQKVLQDYAHIPFCVDYNRSFAPFVRKIKRVVTGRSTPLMVQYRMNVGLIPKEHWLQTTVGAGRIIGDACQIFDLFCYLTDSQPVSVSVEALHASDPNLFPTDNFCASISFADGSVCTLTFTSLGSAKLGAERMELFFDSKSIVLDDYECLVGFGLPSFDETVSAPDKGHTALIRTFFNRLQQKDFVSPIAIDRLCTVARITLIIDHLVCDGGGEQAF